MKALKVTGDVEWSVADRILLWPPGGVALLLLLPQLPQARQQHLVLVVVLRAGRVLLQ